MTSKTRQIWHQTYTGVVFDIESPTSDMVRLVDIAHALSMQCRYNGHCNSFYSVAEHSATMVEILAREGHPREVLRAALMHDAAEAYVGDILSPLKRLLPGLKAIEGRIERVIAERFGLLYPWPEAVKAADLRMLRTEADQIMNAPPRPWTIEIAQIEAYEGVDLLCDEPLQAYMRFMSASEALGFGVPVIMPATQL